MDSNDVTATSTNTSTTRNSSCSSTNGPLPLRRVGRLAPTPSGYLHIGHARTFWIAQQRALETDSGSLIIRIEDLDGPRCKPQYLAEMMDDLKWFGFRWTHGPIASARLGPVAGMDNGESRLKKLKCDDDDNISSVGNLLDLVPFRSFHGESLVPFAHEYKQSKRLPLYRAAWRRLVQLRLVYPSPHSRKDVLGALSAPHEGDEEVIFPPSLRPAYMQYKEGGYPAELLALTEPNKVNWRFRVSDNLWLDSMRVAEGAAESAMVGDDLASPAAVADEAVVAEAEPAHEHTADAGCGAAGDDVAFVDGLQGPQTYRCGRDFGDFVVWRSDGYPSYELAVVVDDITMGVTEVVRGGDLLRSTARQLLLFQALLQGLQDSDTGAGPGTSTSSADVAGINLHTAADTSTSENRGDVSAATSPAPLVVLPPAFYHCDLVREGASGKRLAKRMQLATAQHQPAATAQSVATPATTAATTAVTAPAATSQQEQDAFTLKALRRQGWTPEQIRREKLSLVS